MKTTMMRTALLLLLAGCLAGSLTAQENLRRAMERAEASPNSRTANMANGARISNIEGTQRMTLKSINITNDAALVNDLIAAFEADKSQAGSISESSANGLTTSFECTFTEDGQESKYMFRRTAPDGAALTFQQGLLNNFDFSAVNGGPIRVDMGNVQLQADSIRMKMERNFDRDQMNDMMQEMERMKEEMTKALQEYQQEMQRMLQEVQQNMQDEQQATNRDSRNE